MKPAWQINEQIFHNKPINSEISQAKRMKNCVNVTISDSEPQTRNVGEIFRINLPWTRKNKLAEMEQSKDCLRMRNIEQTRVQSETRRTEKRGKLRNI